jgi:hypothetical protein
MSDDQDWRLEVKLTGDGDDGLFDRLLGRVRGDQGDQVADDVRAAVGHDVVITHDGAVVFAYAAHEPAITAARTAIAGVLDEDAIPGSFTLSHWDRTIDDWSQIDPAPTAEATASQPAAPDGTQRLTRTFVCTAGKLVRDAVERTMADYARRLGVDCAIGEHPHLLTTQVSFTVTGPARKLDEFRAGLKAQGWSTIRAEGVWQNPV